MLKNLQNMSKKEIENLSKDELETVITNVYNDIKIIEKGEELFILEELDQSYIDKMEYLFSFATEEQKEKHIKKIFDSGFDALGDWNKTKKYLGGKVFKNTISNLINKLFKKVMNK